MSVVSERVKEALYTKLSASSDVQEYATGGIYFEQAPMIDNGAAYIVFARQAPGQPTRAFSQTLIAEDDLWIIKGYADEGVSTTISPQAYIAQMLNAAEAAIGTSLTLSAGETWLVERFADVLLPKEDLNDRVIFAGAFNLRVVATES